MNLLNKSALTWIYLLFASPAFATGPAASKPESPKPGRAAPPPEPERYARRCQSRAPDRGTQPQGTLLWGTRQAWTETPRGTVEGRSVLVSVDINSTRKGTAATGALQLVKGRLMGSNPGDSPSLVGTVLQGSSSDGKPVEVAVCGAEPASEDPDMVWYQIEAWNPVTQNWENPCSATGRVPDPRALAVSGVWDASGARHDEPGKFTLACENGVITKCIRWGYKPWASRNGQSLADVHQACTRMARADYCGNGRSHTHEDTTIDMYDRLGVLVPTTEASADWNPARASFEAAWAPDGATCMARTRDGRAMETILQECPGRFQIGAVTDLGEGDRCAVQHESLTPVNVLLRNRSYGAPKGVLIPAGSK